MNSLKLILKNIKYFAVVWVFSSLNFIVGTWVLYIPTVKRNLNLNDSEIGLALFCLALGILCFIPLIPYIIKRIGLGKVTFFAIALFAIAFIFPLLMPTYISLCISLFIVGVFTGITDITMNALVSKIEQTDTINIMSAAHGFFSLGGVLGATIGSVLMPIFNVPVYHMLAISTFIILLNLTLSKYYFNILEEEQPKEKNKFNFKIIKPLIAISFIAFVIMSSEGAIEHWSSLYFIEIVKVTEQNLAGLGFIVFSTTMTIGRFFGDGISAKIGSAKIILLGCILALIGYGCIMVGQFEISVLGFGIVGLGLSVIIPELFRMAGKTKGVKASVGISIVSGIGFAGFLLGPVVLGLISNSFNLKMSFFTLFILPCIALLVNMVVMRRKKT